VWIRWNAWSPSFRTTRWQHEWGDVILMLDDALGDRDHAAEATTCCYDVGGVPPGGTPFRTEGGPRGAARRLVTHCNATPRFEPVCSAVSGSLLGLHSSSGQRPAQLVPRVGVRCWVERGDLVGLGRSSAQNSVDLHGPTHLHKPRV
jgi:hypothetical protein